MDVHWREASGGGHRLTTSVETAAALGVDGVKLLMPWDVPAAERASTAALSRASWSRPTGSVSLYGPAVALEATGTAAREVAAHGCRVAAEIGADILKVAHPGDDGVLRSWCEELGVPVVLLGGGGAVARDELVALVSRGIAAGVRGSSLGARCGDDRPTRRPRSSPSCTRSSTADRCRHAPEAAPASTGARARGRVTYRASLPSFGFLRTVQNAVLRGNTWYYVEVMTELWGDDRQLLGGGRDFRCPVRP